MINFHYNHMKCGGSGEATKKFIQNILDTADKSTRVFKKVTIARTILTQTSPINFRHEVSLSTEMGPFSPEIFLRMLDYPQNFSSAAWAQHIEQFNEKQVNIMELSIITPSEFPPQAAKIDPLYLKKTGPSK